MRDDWMVLGLASQSASRGESFVLVTVTSAKGSTPRDPGARLLWMPGADGGTWHGTVGGGQFEHLVRADAEECLAKRECFTREYVLGADADQCCGGVMQVFFEFVGPRERVVIFGAGHVAQAIVELLEAASLEVVVVDDRPEWNSAERFPGAKRALAWDEGVEAVSREPGRTIAMVMTCSHDTDFELLRKLVPVSPAHLGLIGSRSKRACLFGRLVASGLDEAAVGRVKCPIGIGDTGKEPKLVAISIAAEILIESRKMSGVRDRGGVGVRRG